MEDVFSLLSNIRRRPGMYLGSATEELESLLGTKLGSLDPDAIESCVPGLAWEPLPGAEASDIHVAAAIDLRADGGRDEDVYVVTDVSFIRAVGAFVAAMSAFASFCESYRDEFGERVFSGGDVIVWTPKSRRLWLVHHEGLFSKKVFTDKDG